MPKFSIPYGRQDITEEDILAVTNTLTSDYLTQGPQVKAFEEGFSKYTGAKYAVAVSNGTAALHLSMMALGLQKGQRIITTPITFAASANAALYVGAEVHFADINSSTGLLDLNKVRDLIESKPAGYFSGIVPVNFAGYPCDIKAFKSLGDKHNLWVLEDSCHSPGASMSANGEITKSGGGLADASIFSFHPVKHIACGEGGMITTNSEDLYNTLTRIRTHGITKDPNLMNENHGGWYYEMVELGYNYRMPDLNCALGLSQLSRANDGVKKRRQIAEVYYESLAELPITFIKPESDIHHAYHLFVIRTSKRKALYDYLRENGIYAQVHYIPVHTLPYYQDLGFKKGDFPSSEKFYDECLSLPMFPTLKDEEIQHVINSVRTFFKG